MSSLDVMFIPAPGLGATCHQQAYRVSFYSQEYPYTSSGTISLSTRLSIKRTANDAGEIVRSRAVTMFTSRDTAGFVSARAIILRPLIAEKAYVGSMATPAPPSTNDSAVLI